MLRVSSLCALALAGLAGAAQADVYRSVDSGGAVHYTDRWVPGSELIHLDKRHPAAGQATAHINADKAQLAASNEKIAAEQQQLATERAVRQDVTKTRETQCKDAKDKYQKVIQARRVFRAGPDGQKQYLTDAEADQQRVKAREDMTLACGPS